MNTHHSKIGSKRSEAAKRTLQQEQEMQKKKDAAMREGREAAKDPNECALIPAKYHTKPEEGDAWFAGFMAERQAVHA